MPDKPSSRVPPYNEHAEAAYLGAALMDPVAIGLGIEAGLGHDAFWVSAHGHIWSSILKLHTAGHPVDQVTVMDDLQRQGLLDHAGGVELLAKITFDTPGTAAAGHYAKIVADHMLLRRIIGTASDITELGYSQPDDPALVVEEAERQLAQLLIRRGHNTTIDLATAADTHLDYIHALADPDSSDLAKFVVPTGFPVLDNALHRGWRPQQMIVIGGRPGMGKSSLAAQFGLFAAETLGRPVLYYSMEMTRQDLAERFFSAATKVPLKDLRRGELTEEQFALLHGAIDKFSAAPFFIDDNTHQTIATIRQHARRFRAEHGDLALVVIDYIQLMTSENNYGSNRQQEVSDISRGIKLLGGELDAPVIALSQLSRDLEKRDDKRPKLSDLRESGSLEQDADIVLFCYRDEMYHEDSPNLGEAEIIIAKHRAGALGVGRLAFLDRFTLFASLRSDGADAEPDAF